FDATRHAVASIWDLVWRNTVARAQRGVAEANTAIGRLPGLVGGVLARVRSTASSIWNTIWANTVARVQSGVATVNRLIGAMPAKIRSIFSGAGTWLVAAGRNVIQGLLNGLTAIWNKVKSFISSIAGWIKAHKGPIALDAKLLEPAGRALMSGLHLGLTAGAKGPLGFIAGLTGTIGSLLSGGLGAIKGLFGGGGVAGPGGGAPGANAALARRMMPAWGSGAQWAAWNYVAMRESGWNQFARNPSSGAYGIPQALPPGKMGAAANPPRSNPAAQISWMIGYIRSRYVTPIGAAAHERAFNWYDRGGLLMP